MNNIEIIGIDHGWSQMKTSNTCFNTSIKELANAPAFHDNVLEYDDRYFAVGEERLEVLDSKVENENFYLLTLVAIAKELEIRGKSEADVVLAVGLPLTRFSAERKPFIDYLSKNGDVVFGFEQKLYRIHILNVLVYPQCYAAVAGMLEVTETAEIQKVTMKDEYAVGKIIIEKTDEVTKKPIAGVEFEIRDKDGKVIETVVTDKDGHAESKELPICIYNEDGSFKEDIHYYVVETKAAEGYILDETVHDVVLQYDDNAPECVEYTLSLTNKPTEPKLPQTGDNFNPWLYAGLGLGALALGLFAAFWKKKEDGAEEA